MNDTQSFLCAVSLILCVTLAGTRIIDWTLPAKVQACTITFSDAGGNRHEFVGQGVAW
jgi:hypothetical protein